MISDLVPAPWLLVHQVPKGDCCINCTCRSRVGDPDGCQRHEVRKFPCWKEASQSCNSFQEMATVQALSSIQVRPNTVGVTKFTNGVQSCYQGFNQGRHRKGQSLSTWLSWLRKCQSQLSSVSSVSCHFLDCSLGGFDAIWLHLPNLPKIVWNGQI